MSPELQKKVDRAVRFLRSIPDEDPVEVAYSGGKDSDVILELARMAGINYRAIYKNTTIDPPGTIKHVIERGVEIVRPKKTFFQIVEKKGFPSRFQRFCCEQLKEYKVLDRAIVGVRRDESNARAERYQEPEMCRVYSKRDKSKNVRQYYPLLDWTTDDVAEFLKERGVKCAPVYYDEDGTFHPERRLGCMCCPLASKKHRIEEFKRYPKMVRAYIRAGEIYCDTHQDSKVWKYVKDVYERFVLNMFCDSVIDFKERFGQTLFAPPINCKEFLSDYFKVEL